MEQILLHAVGDFWIQTDKQALGKKNSGLYGITQCFLHCVTYSIPFLLIGPWQAVLMIFLTHYMVDRTRIIDYVIAIKNGTKRNGQYDISNYGFAIERPKLITTWLYIACDNIVHLVCNYFALTYL
jgi:hypothetical protein